MRSTLWLLTLACAMGACDLGHEDTTSTASSQLGTVLLPTTGWGDPGVTSSVDTYGRVSWVGGDWHIPITLPAGSPLSTVSIPIVDNGAQNGHPSDGNTVTAFIGTPGGGTFNALLFTTSAGTGAPQSLVLTFQSPHVIADGEQLQVLLHPQKPGPFGPTPATVPSQVGGIQVTQAPLSRTLIIPTQPATNTRGVNLATNGMGNLIAGNVSDPANGSVEYIPLPLEVGIRINGWRVRVQDSQFSGGSARIQSQLMTTTNNQHVPAAIATSGMSSGGGAEETISASISVTTAPSTQYWISVYDQVGTATGFVRRLELDIN